MKSNVMNAFKSLGRVAPRRFSTKLTYAPVTDITKLGNGLRVASETIPGETATVGVWIDAGSRYETEQNNGTAHFLEHMAFKGTKNRTREQIEVEIENIGGHLNAYTSREQTVYYARVFKDDVPKAMEILSDILTNSLLDEKAIETERGVILREMAEVNKNYEEVIMDHLHEVAFMGTGLGRTILGPEDNIKRLSKKDLQDYIQTHYTANRFVVAAAGAVDHKQIVDLTQKHFGGLPTAPAGGKVSFDPAIFTGADKRIRFDSMGEAHVALAFKSASWTSEYAVPFMVIQSLLGSWDRSHPAGASIGSKLARGLHQDGAHSMMTFNTCYNDAGLFGVYFVAPDDKLEVSMFHVTEQIVRLAHEVTDEEVERAKNQLKTQLLLSLDSFSSTCEDIGRQMLTYGRRMSLAEMITRVDNITTDDIKATAMKFFIDEEHALAAVGPIWELPDIHWIRRRSYWARY